MDSFNNAAVIWFAIGFVFFLLEFALPGFIVFFFGVGAWVTALVLLFSDISINTQLLIFIVTSILTIVLFRRQVKRLMWSRKDTSEIEDELIGRTGVAETYIGPGKNGKVDFKGTSWDATSEDTINPGDKVTITGNDSILLIVKSTKSST